MRKKLYLISSILLVAFLTFISLKETFSLASKFISFFDKIAHTCAYIALTFFWSRSLMLFKPSFSVKKVLLIVALFLFIYGIIIEVLQTRLTVSRVGEFQDVIANVLGIVLGSLLVRYIYKLELNYNKGLFF